VNSTTPLTAAEIETRLEELLVWALASHRPAGPLAAALAPFTRAEQEFALRWIDAIARTNSEMAFQFTTQVPLALRCMELAGIEQWVVRAMDVYDKMGMYPAYAVFRDVEEFARSYREQKNGANFEDVAHVLELFVRGLSGRPLKLECTGDIYTDTASLFLPATVTRFTDRERNFGLYKAMVAHQWAQTRYGTFRTALHARLESYSDPERAVRLFHALETVRLDARLAQDLAGLHRQMAALRAELGETLYPPAWAQRIARLQAPGATVDDTLALVTELYDSEVPAPLCYQGALHPDRAEAVIAARVGREKQALQQVLLQMLHDQDGEQPAAQPESLDRRFCLERGEPNELSGEFSISINLDGKPVAPPDEVRALMDSILQDLGDIPDEYLTAAGDGGYNRRGKEKKDDSGWKASYEDEGALLYNEWDYRRRHYRKDWCVLREIDVHPLDEPFVARTRSKYAGLIHSLRKGFEALRGEDKLLKKQCHGDNVDFDALVEAWADLHTGRELSERLFTKHHKSERNIAVMFMIDMSGSTKGWINDAERESLVMLCEALEVLGDRYAIYGFSGMTRKRCELYRIKRFDEPYNELVQSRIAGIAPRDYTRMGVTIRHLTKLLHEVEARTKLLITLSDGKPDDYDGYRGDYGIEDTRQALIEARRSGIHPFCITIDSEARDYLPHMYGAVNWTLVEDVKKLPLKVSDIYRRLTA
jgi:nitric oxide reductase NorD protein